MNYFVSLFQTASGAWHILSILKVSSWLLGFLVTGIFLFANLKVNRDDRLEAYQKEQQRNVEATEARAKIEELEEKQRPRTISAEQKKVFMETTKEGPFGPVVLATRSPLPNKEQENFTMQLRYMLDEAGFGVNGSNIVNGFSTGVEFDKYLGFVSNNDTPPPYFSNVAGGLYKIGLISPGDPIAVNNKSAKEGLLYVLIPEK